MIENMKKSLLITVIICLLFTHLAASQGTKPNFVIILADDLGYGDLSYTGSVQINTPNIDAIAKKGMFFPQAYVSSPVCSPSRAGILTGRISVSFGYDNNVEANQPGFDSQFLGLPVNIKTIPNYLSPLGYVSGIIGKWHLGFEKQFHPINRGFDEFWGYLDGGHDYFEEKDTSFGYKAKIQCNYKTTDKITYITDNKGNECVDFIKRHKKQPFFLYASFNAPHTPMQATDKDLNLYSFIKNKKRRTYAAMVHRLDVNVGKIMAAIDKEGLSENTVVIFMSDNGGPGEYNSSINAPYNGKKGTVLEGGIRVPFMISWPGTIPAGQVYNNVISSLDILPTFVSLAGGTTTAADKLDGVNLIPYILKQNTAKPHEELKWRFTISAAILDGKWKLIRLPDRLPMLFDLEKDKSELDNLSLKNLDVTRHLLKKLGNWDVSLPHPLFMEGAEWKKHQLMDYDVKFQLVQPKR